MRTVKDTGGARTDTKEVEREVRVSVKSLVGVRDAYICEGKFTNETQGIERERTELDEKDTILPR